jgi:putative tryptophan/tyrosine transport system substrate-binding protein
MIFIGKRLVLGFGLILLASGILLATDLDRRAGGDPRIKRVALLQQASVSALDEGTAGVIDGLADGGFREGDNLRLTRFNAHGDIGTANMIARGIVNDPYDLVITVSTLSLQHVAAANKDRHMPHVFGIVADPFSAGVGLDRAHPERHPAHLVGQGIFLPVKDSFELARQMNPGLKKVGVVWNPSESNSLAFTTNAREVCRDLGIELLEATADNSAGVLEATQSLIGRGAQAIWAGGDVTISQALDSVIATVRKAGIPVFSITPGKPDRGTLFDVGANFYECGQLTGILAADVLKGADPASIPIKDVLQMVRRRLVVNRRALDGLKGWSIPDDIVRRADVVVDQDGVREQAPGK